MKICIKFENKNFIKRFVNGPISSKSAFRPLYNMKFCTIVYKEKLSAKPSYILIVIISENNLDLIFHIKMTTALERFTSTYSLDSTRV